MNKLGNSKNRCINKLTFPTTKEAQTHLKVMNARSKGSRDTPKKMNIYECPLCGKYHLTSKSKLQWRRNKAKAAKIQNARQDERLIAYLEVCLQ